MSLAAESLTASADGAEQPPGRQPRRTHDTVSPAASRRPRQRWHDPRVWAGILLLAASAVVGGRALAGAADTTAVWSAARDLDAGRPVTSNDMTVAHVHFDSAAQRGQYLSADHPLPSGTRLSHSLTEGELVAASALVDSRQVQPQLPIGVDDTDAPHDLAPGQRVAIWAVADEQDDRAPRAALVLSDVEVLAVTDGGDGLSGARQVLVEVASDADVRSALDSLAGARAVLVRVGT